MLFGEGAGSRQSRPLCQEEVHQKLQHCNLQKVVSLAGELMGRLNTQLRAVRISLEYKNVNKSPAKKNVNKSFFVYTIQ
jgi:hypothetical protein